MEKSHVVYAWLSKLQLGNWMEIVTIKTAKVDEPQLRQFSIIETFISAKIASRFYMTQFSPGTVIIKGQLCFDVNLDNRYFS